LILVRDDAPARGHRAVGLEEGRLPLPVFCGRVLAEQDRRLRELAAPFTVSEKRWRSTRSCITSPALITKSSASIGVAVRFPTGAAPGAGQAAAGGVGWSPRAPLATSTSATTQHRRVQSACEPMLIG
jgi:hypothetical protein